ncbi:MAG TPA: hypothetical protein VLN91_04305 [Nitrospirota bacterium]|nr:hypothetical protein [Nitrospirota bacterium]
MAAVKDIKKGVCDNMFGGLSDVKKRIEALRDDLARTYKTEDNLSVLYERHLGELIEQIDWKLQILSHACPYDWKGSAEAEYTDNTVSVGPADTSIPDFAGGYLGG